MSVTRRRFLTISAACALVPGHAQAETWRAETWEGRAFGGDVSLRIHGPRAQAAQALADARGVIRQVEGLFSLYDPASDLSRLNRTGVLNAPAPRFLQLMRAADHAYTLTGGLFDPTVGALWAALAAGQNPKAASAAIGWDRVSFNTDQIRLAPAQALTFNGIAQGFATDIVTEVLIAHGLTDVLVNIGEYRSVGGPWRLGLADPTHGRLGTRTLHTGAIATSSPGATPLGASGHIIHASARPQWSTVSVEARSAALADSLSTGLVLANRALIEQIRQRPDVSRITLVDWNGDLTTL